MSVKRTIPYTSGIFSITFTCYQWLPLIEKCNGYDIVYKWFDHLKLKGHYVLGYVIMPNHVHVMIAFVNSGQDINTIVGNGKRFMAYAIIEQLKARKEISLLESLREHIETARRENNKKHNVWELSFDWKYCVSEKFMQQKLDYYHNNPVTGKWNLCASPVEYAHSSAKQYLTGSVGQYSVTSYSEVIDIELG